MSIETRDQFVQILKKSRIASAEKIAIWTKGIGADKNPQNVARLLIENGHLTKWQAKQLLGGNAKLKIGNFILLRGLNQDEIGKQFVARQSKLDRLVKITFLNREFSAQLHHRQDLVRQVATTADFDHDNLEHLHLIDREGERYLIVTDFEKSRTLSDPELVATLQKKDLPLILSQAMGAMSFAHRHGLAHGALAEADLAVDENMQLTIQNTVVSFLVHSLAEENLGQVNNTDSDIESLTRIGGRLATRILKDEQTRQPYELVFDDLRTRRIKLAEAADRFREFQIQTNKPAVTHSAENQAKVASKESMPAPPPEAKGIFSNPWAMMGLNAILLIAISAGLYYSGWFGSNQKSAANGIQDPEQKKELPSLDISQIPDKQKSDSENELPSVNTNLETDQELDVGSKIGLMSGEEIESSEKKLIETSAKTETNLKSQSETSAQDKSDSLLAQFNSIVSEDSDVEIANSKSSNSKRAKQIKLDKSTTTPSEQDSDSEPVHAESGIPKHIALGDLESTNPISIGPINSSAILKLVVDENVAPKGTTFKLRGGGGAAWNVSLSQANGSHDIATISIVDNHLHFSWTQEAADDFSTANHLRNCLLKIDQSGDVRFVALRSPVAIEGFKLDREKPQIKMDLVDLDHLPTTTRVQLQELDEEKFGEIHFNGDENRHFSRKANLEVHFSELPEYQMLSLLLSSDLKKKNRLEASLRIILNPQQRPKLADSKSVEAAKQLLESATGDLQQKHDYLKKTKIDEIRKRFNLTSDAYPNSKRLDEVKLMKKQLELLENQGKKFREVLAKIESFFSDPIPVEIYFEVEGHRVVVATTTG